MGLPPEVERVDRALAGFMSANAVRLLRWALGVTYLWFGALKIVGESPVADLAGAMALGLPRHLFVRLLGVWEMAIGVALLFRLALRLTLALFAVQLAGTFLMLFLYPQRAFRKGNPLLLTYTGEFVIKNLVLLAAGIAIGATVRRPSEKIG